MIRIGIEETEDFLMIRETLTRIGIANRETKHMWQSCHIIQKNGFYYIAHFKELLRRDGRDVVISQEDIDRRDDIVSLLESWGLCTVIDLIEPPKRYEFHVIPHKDRQYWTLKSKYIFNKNI
ncbi:translation repressor protein [Aeromonas phage ZPAH1]|nr:translation repressor protein [Aeromonas phage Aswh_1]QQG33972.1 translation repressor protein [Aeromonas phage ZPAH1]